MEEGQKAAATVGDKEGRRAAYPKKRGIQGRVLIEHIEQGTLSCRGQESYKKEEMPAP